LDVVGLLQEAFVKGAGTRVVVRLLRFLLFEVDVGFPQQLGHVEDGLLGREFEDGARAVGVLQQAFELGEVDPGLADAGVPFDPFFVEGAAAHEFEESRLHVDVGAEELVLGTHADGQAHCLSCLGEVLLSEVEVGFEDPDFGEGELFMRDEFQCFGVDLAGALRVAVL
ncbi:hypothetical protein Tdes44962_MAKER06109, partial [Teratosphaeria destructans]